MLVKRYSGKRTHVGETLTCHQLNDMRRRLLEDHLDVIGVAFFELLLQEATAMLVLAQTIDLSCQGLEGNVSVACVVCYVSEILIR